MADFASRDNVRCATDHDMGFGPCADRADITPFVVEPTIKPTTAETAAIDSKLGFNGFEGIACRQ
jgi:hypothetical protein